MPSTAYTSGVELANAFAAGISDQSIYDAIVDENATHTILPKSLGRPPFKAKDGGPRFAAFRKMVPNISVCHFYS
jgi:hypothetical protein